MPPQGAWVRFTGREGMTVEQVLRCSILERYCELTCEELAFHPEDADSFRGFARLEMGQYPCKSLLQENIKAKSSWVYRKLRNFRAGIRS